MRDIAIDHNLPWPALGYRRDIMLRKSLIGFAGAIAVGLLVLYALWIWMFRRRQSVTISKPRGGQVVHLSHARSARQS